ncbi:MAG: ABC transporter ATP-binding protein [Bacteroidia bacterium]|jgi:lipopolysaccharide transport system ATP-binding protein|nr:ABC transporter ATP-binding protein [Bacteroidia bacterium]
MSYTAIQVEHLSKQFILRQQQARNYTALRDVLTDKAKRLVGRGSASTERSTFWALDDVNFTIESGERVGIIGRNGAGKSTLLKVLSRIVTPTKGRVTLEGRIASLLEVGTGFHPELSGRENIYLNGSILGMTKAEIKSRFDEIVDFAEVEKFLDTPVKRYSSGMYVRLAFAVAAHLEPEILIVDEVLAVGDAAFQKKCLGKMRDISTRHGRTILFVSHNMGAIRNFCNRTIYLEKGQVKADGETEKILPLYFGLGNQIELEGFTITAKPEDAGGEWVRGTRMKIEIAWDKQRYAPGWHVDAVCYTLEGEKLFALQSHTIAGFNSDDPSHNGIVFMVNNAGFIDRDIRLDIGIRRTANEPYHTVIENALLLTPGNKFITHNQVPDVILVPEATAYSASF